MSAGKGVLAAALAGLLCACGISGDSSQAKSHPWTATLPPADDRPEPDPNVSGRFPLANQVQDGAAVLDGDTTMGYRKGLKQVGANAIIHPDAGIPRGQNFQLGWMGECAYVGTADVTQYVAHRYYMTPVIATQQDTATGLAVLDASKPDAPELVDIIPNPEIQLDTGVDPATLPFELVPDPANPTDPNAFPPNTHRVMVMNWFAIATHEGRRVMVAGAHTLMGVFDATDCRHPVLKSLISLHHENVAVHGLRISRDGYRVFVSGVLTFDATAVVDITDLANPKVVKTWEHGAHDVELSGDETRLYMNSLTGKDGNGAITGGGLRIVDVTGISACSEGGQDGHHHHAADGKAACDVEFKELSHYQWTGLSHANHVGHRGGHTYAFTVDEYASDENNPQLCEPGWVRVVDITNERDPQQVSAIQLGVSDPAQCRTTYPDSVTYNSHYLALDDEADTKLVFVSWYASGLRVFDVTDPQNPKEIAYLVPPPSPATVYQSNFGKPLADSTISHIRWRPETGQLWVVNVNGGFTILQFTQSAELPAGY